MKIKDLVPNGLFCDGDWIESKDQDPEGEIRLIQLADIGDGHFIDKSSRFMNLETATRLKCTYLKKNDILIARMPDPIGRACIFPYDESQKFVTVVDVALLRLGSDVSSKYVMYALNSTPIRNSIKGQVTGTTRQRITRKKIGELDIPLPPLEEQKRIAAILDAADDYRQKTKALIDKYDQLTQSLFLDMFGDPVTNPMGWDTQKLKNNVSIVSGFAFKSKLFNQEEQGMPIIRIRDVGKPKAKTFYSGDYKPDYLIHSGDLIIGMDGDFRLAEWKGGTALLNQRVCKINSDSSFMDDAFLKHWLPKELKIIEDRTSFATVKHLSVKSIYNIDMPIIPEILRARFMKRVALIEKQKQQAEASLVKAEELFSSLLQRAFKGELTS